LFSVTQEEFCNTIGTFETCRMRRAISEFEGKAENICSD
jgi:hypothetical protein